MRKFSGYSMHKRRRSCKEKKGKTDEKEIREFFYGLRNVKVAIEASANYSYIVDALAKGGYEVLVAHPLKTRAIAEAKIKNSEAGFT